MYRSDKVYYVVVLGKYLGIYGLRHIITLDINNKKTMEQIKKEYHEVYSKLDHDEFFICKNKKEINSLLAQHNLYGSLL